MALPKEGHGGMAHEALEVDEPMSCTKKEAQHEATYRAKSVSTTKQVDISTLAWVLAILMGIVGVFYVTGLLVDGFLYAVKWVWVTIGPNPWGWEV